MGSTQQQESITTMLVIDELKTENERIKNSLDETQKHLIDLEQKHKNELDAMQQQITKSKMEKNNLLKAEAMNNEKLKQLRVQSTWTLFSHAFFAYFFRLS